LTASLIRWHSNGRKMPLKVSRKSTGLTGAKIPDARPYTRQALIPLLLMHELWRAAKSRRAYGPLELKRAPACIRRDANVGTALWRAPLSCRGCYEATAVLCRPTRLSTDGMTIMFNKVDVNRHERMTMAIGASISLPGLPAPSATGISARPAASAVIRIGETRSDAPRRMAFRRSASPSTSIRCRTWETSIIPLRVAMPNRVINPMIDATERVPPHKEDACHTSNQRKRQVQHNHEGILKALECGHHADAHVHAHACRAGIARAGGGCAIPRGRAARNPNCHAGRHEGRSRHPQSPMRQSSSEEEWKQACRRNERCVLAVLWNPEPDGHQRQVLSAAGSCIVTCGGDTI
jgi:hypothetical protein